MYVIRSWYTNGDIFVSGISQSHPHAGIKDLKQSQEDYLWAWCITGTPSNSRRMIVAYDETCDPLPGGESVIPLKTAILPSNWFLA